MRLFPELIISVIEELATPDFTLAYIYPPLVLRTLLNLALVSHAVSSWTMPFIYACIRTTSKKQIQLLHRTLCSTFSIRRRVKSFAIFERNMSSPDYSYWNYTAFPEARGPIQEICNLLDVMSPNLQRLTLEFPYPIGYDSKTLARMVRTHLRGLRHLIEFVNIGYSVFHNPYTKKQDYFILRGWKSLSRLALFGPTLDANCIGVFNKLPHLRHLVLVSSCRGLTQLLRSSSGLRIVGLIDPMKSELEEEVQALKERNDIQFDLHLPDHEDVDDPEKSTQDWCRSAVENGTLWEGRSLHGYNTWEKVLSDNLWEGLQELLEPADGALQREGPRY